MIIVVKLKLFILTQFGGNRMLGVFWLTTDCNMKCIYCYEGNEKKKMYMNEETIDKAIEFLMTRAKELKDKRMNIEFHGGEPLLAYKSMEMKIIKSQMTMGELIAFIEYTTLFINPCIRILKSNASIQKLKVSINRIYDFLEMKNSIAQNNYGIKIRNRINEIVFDNVSFSYDKKMVIENLSFKLERGKTYAFVGETGCGKSTIVNLLFRLWDTKSGNIMIDGENIKEYNLFSLRKQLSIATQNVYIKDDSIENNILMGRKKEDCAYDEICKLVGMESILSKFPKEKDVSVGENGNKLSGGQKQRIAMARALERV